MVKELIDDRRIFNIVDYGADPTGVRDSSDAIQRAFDDARKHGGVVLTPTGEYRKDKAINI